MDQRCTASGPTGFLKKKEIHHAENIKPQGAHYDDAKQDDDHDDDNVNTCTSQKNQRAQKASNTKNTTLKNRVNEKRMDCRIRKCVKQEGSTDTGGNYSVGLRHSTKGRATLQ